MQKSERKIIQANFIKVVRTPVTFSKLKTILLKVLDVETCRDWSWWINDSRNDHRFPKNNFPA